MKIDPLNYEVIFQYRLLNGRDEADILKLLDGSDGIILNSAIACLMNTKNRNGLIKLISMIEKASDKTKTNIYAAIPYIGLPEWKQLIQEHLKIINADTKSQFTPLREYSMSLLSAQSGK